MASAATRVTNCELRPVKSEVWGREPGGPPQVTIPRPKAARTLCCSRVCFVYQKPPQPLLLGFLPSP
ncbi:unnamed protein product [Sphenostylis stenocarpa]|uniref:Uncharacterized protein n=1 Tax=Sphenostylis stenocarpa TaxID=92480 RepID=A0AA86TAW2_9FABA|nr:unnamed protein product [Sphenostylis stenocarpa]